MTLLRYRMLKKQIAIWVLLALSGKSSLAAHEADSTSKEVINDEYLEDEFGHDQFGDFYGSDEFINIATGIQQNINKAPAVASVITAEQIKQSGARNLIDALKMIPGLNISRSSQAMSPKFNFRGITSTYGPQTLVMIDGVPTKSVVRGDNHVVWGEFPVNSISRIEIIRGPGSALYGADAFAGVINIITHSTENLQKSEVGFGFGSDNSKNGWFKTGMQSGDFQAGISVEYLSSNGSKEIIETDAQTIFDDLAEQLFNLPAVSHAPGGTNLGFDALDLFLKAKYQRVNLGVSLQHRGNVGTGQGISEALDPHGKFGGDKLMIDLSHETIRMDNDWKITSHFNYYQSTQEIEKNINLLPPGTLFGAFPDGIIGNPGWKESTTIFEVNADYTGWPDHQLTVGTGYIIQDLYEVTESKNFLSDLSPNPSGLVDVSDTDDVFMPEYDRNNKYLLVQNIWKFAPDWELTMGIRYDDYSDFGSTTNPRVALVWSGSLKSTTKFLYGRAFRAPGFAELLTVNNPVSLGNPSIQPETIDSFELAYSYRHDDRHTSNINLFHYKIEDFITFVPDEFAPTATAQNVGKRTGYGIEAETGFDIHRDISVKANYSYVKAKDDLVNDDVGDYPNHQLKAELLWQINPNWSLFVNTAFIGERKRTYFDQRKALDGYIDLGFNLNYQNYAGWRVSLSIDNALDDEILEPSIGPGEHDGSVNIPGDLPLSGIQYNFKIAKSL